MSIQMLKQNPNFINLINKNQQYVEKFSQSALMKLIKSSEMEKKEARIKLLDCIQVFSNFFQKAVLLRAILTDNLKYLKIAQEHLNEEFNHHISLMNDRDNKPPVFDPILETSASWFAWKMLTLDNFEKTFLMHNVLEASAHTFFVEANKVMQKYGETDYFKIHSEIDDHHQSMGLEFLNNLRQDEYSELINLQFQGWEILFTTCNRIATLTNIIL